MTIIEKSKSVKRLEISALVIRKSLKVSRRSSKKEGFPLQSMMLNNTLAVLHSLVYNIVCFRIMVLKNYIVTKTTYF